VSSKPGGAKPGHKGCFRALAEQPDRIIEHRPTRCPGCGHGFAPDALGEVIGAHDTVYLPPVLPVVTRSEGALGNIFDRARAAFHGKAARGPGAPAQGVRRGQ
jgi:hypothetical protein